MRNRQNTIPGMMISVTSPQDLEVKKIAHRAWFGDLIADAAERTKFLFV